MKSAHFDYTQCKRGFTLIELLVVITIIAILSIIGITIFTSVQKGARDARRKADIENISRALEVNYTGLAYPPLSDSWFSGGAVPKDPLSGSETGCQGNACKYCDRESTAPALCTGSASGSSGHAVLVNGLQLKGTGNATYTICANLETGSPGYFCMRNQQ